MRSHIHRKLSVTISAIGVAAGCLSGAIPSRTAAATAPDFILRTEVSADGHETAFQSSRPATEAERGDLSISPDGWVQETPRESYSRGTVPLPLVPDWVGGRPRANSSLLFCDADHDGDQDLVVGTYYANMYPPIPDYYNFIYLNNGGVLEATPSWLSADQKHTSDLAWGRINSDAYPDLFVANGGESFAASQIFWGRDGMLLNTSGFSLYDECWTTGCSLYDFDKDGDLDLTMANQGNTSVPYRPVYLFINTGDGLNPNPWWASNEIGITESADWADMDGDGWADLAVAGWSGWNTGVYKNLHTTLQTTFAWTTGHPERTDGGARWADVNGDGHPDLAVGGNGAPDWLFLNTGTTLASTPAWSSSEPYHGVEDMAWIDIDMDGDQDLATVNFATGHTRIYLNNNGVLSTTADWMYDDSSSGTTLTFGDVNGDGQPDLAVGCANGPQKVFLNTGTPTGIPETAADLPRAGQIRLVAGPNPFFERVSVQMESGTPVRIEHVEVIDAAGRKIATLSGAGEGSRGAPARAQSWSWRPEAGTPAGVYFIRAEARDAAGHARTAVTRIIRAGR